MINSEALKPIVLDTELLHAMEPILRGKDPVDAFDVLVFLIGLGSSTRWTQEEVDPLVEGFALRMERILIEQGYGISHADPDLKKRVRRQASML